MAHVVQIIRQLVGAPNTPLLLRVERIIDEGLLIRRPRFNTSGSLFREREVKRLGVDRGSDGLGFSIVGGYDEKLSTCAPFTVGLGRSAFLSLSKPRLSRKIVNSEQKWTGDCVDKLQVKTVFPKSPAARCGLKPGNQILAANDESLEGLSHEKAAVLLKSLRGRIIFTIMCWALQARISIMNE